MGKTVALGIAGATISVAMLAVGFAAGSRTDVAAAPQQTAAIVEPAAATRGEIETVVRDYLLSNPEILSDMQVALEEKERELQRVAQVETIASSSDAIFDAEHDGVIGNPEGSVTIVEFFDYNCGFCRRAMDDMDAMVEANPDLRFVLKEFPILGPDSQKAHVVSMAFRALAPEKYADFHRELFSGERATEESAIRAALAQGVDEAALREEMKNPAITDAFNQTYELASRLSITGTPSYVVGEEVVFGALGRAVLQEKVEQVRATN